MNQIMEIDLSKRLEIRINNTKPVALEDLSLSLLAFNHQFHKFVDSETNKETEICTELLIKEVRTGSIVIELVSYAAPILPLLWEGGTLTQWASVVQNTCKWLLGKLDRPPRELTKQDLQDWNKFVEPVAKDNASQLNINVSDNGKVINQFFINSNDANTIQKRISGLIENYDTPEDNIHRRKVMYWYQTKFDPNSDTGNKAIIDGLSKTALKVMFENNAVKDAMLHADSKFGKPWHELAYIVDVEVQTVRGIPKLYKVLKYYPEHTFDPED
ncbi:hypothetical protein EMM73_04010 [Rheinheimera sediminis]|uniref:hypothetical protein n=1 Tax=Rheinheimera sp. YQF-1 TaxID=2499626 RepID=UPI000FDA78FC|nr:hypothetical protein [Rheinheimera sp. YQF-1]RVT47918.1 hypothetical protein EMM73_04010 [Rheinheimera sp. YQF-1]